MLASSGVKLLDFGLARLRDPGAPDDDPSGAPTRAGLTAEGSLLGTLQYMSPEQLDGKRVDARSDIVAFGATPYEMLTGARPFDGDGQASVIGSIMKDEPAPWSSDGAELFCREGQAMMTVAVDGSAAAYSAGQPERRYVDDQSRNYDTPPTGGSS